MHQRNPEDVAYGLEMPEVPGRDRQNRIVRKRASRDPHVIVAYLMTELCMYLGESVYYGFRSRQQGTFMDFIFQYFQFSKSPAVMGVESSGFEFRNGSEGQSPRTVVDQGGEPFEQWSIVRAPPSYPRKNIRVHNYSIGGCVGNHLQTKCLKKGIYLGVIILYLNT